MASQNQGGQGAEQSEAERAIEERRKILRLGIYAAATTPMLIAMTTSAQAQTSPVCGITGLC